MPTEPEGNFCWECGGEILDGEDWYADPKTPPLDVDDCLCKDCCLGHLDEVIEEAEEEITKWKAMKADLGEPDL
jgi:hypothetical protein